LWLGCVYRSNLGAIAVDAAFESISETELIMVSPLIQWCHQTSRRGPIEASIERIYSISSSTILPVLLFP